MRVLIRFLFVLTAVFALTSASAQEITKKRGKYKFYFPSGKVSSSGKVKHYHRTGQWKYYDEQGNVVTIANFINDTINGRYEEFYPGNIPFIRGEYCMNKKCGNWKTLDRDGRIISDENFVEAQPHGMQRYWYPNGVMRDSVVMDHGVQVYLKSWYNSGKVRAIETYKEGKPHGKWFFYSQVSSDTFPEWTDEYSNGLKHGWHYAWKGETLIQSFHYKEGELDGTSSRFDEATGKLIVEENYSAGVLHGTSKYYRNGMLLRVDQYEKGFRDAAQTEYAREGYVMKRKWFTMGVLDSMYMYHANGKTAVIQKYVPGTTNSWWKEWDANGFLLLEGFMKNERRHGDWCVHYTSGQVHSCTPYKDGVIQGLYTRWYPNGKKMLQYEIDKDGKIINSSIWNAKGQKLQPSSKEYQEIYESNLPGSMFTDMRDYNRNVIDRVVEEGRVEEEDFYGPTTELDFNGPHWWIEEEKPADTNQVYSYCDVMPEFPGGWEAMREYVKKNTRYPVQAHDKEGTVYVSYIVERNGYVTNIEVVKGVIAAPELDEEAKRVVSTFPPHSPGEQNGAKVRSKCIVPIKFGQY